VQSVVVRGSSTDSSLMVDWEGSNVLELMEEAATQETPAMTTEDTKMQMGQAEKPAQLEELEELETRRGSSGHCLQRCLNLETLGVVTSIWSMVTKHWGLGPNERCIVMYCPVPEVTLVCSQETLSQQLPNNQHITTMSSSSDSEEGHNKAKTTATSATAHCTSVTLAKGKNTSASSQLGMLKCKMWEKSTSSTMFYHAGIGERKLAGQEDEIRLGHD
jgi:hypothetical protein